LQKCKTGFSADKGLLLSRLKGEYAFRKDAKPPFLARYALLQAYAPFASCPVAASGFSKAATNKTCIQRIWQQHESSSCREPGQKRKASRRPDKTPGAFLNNATCWPGYGRTSGMRCVIARAERPWIGSSDFPIWPGFLLRHGLTANHHKSIRPGFLRRHSLKVNSPIQARPHTGQPATL